MKVSVKAIVKVSSVAAQYALAEIKGLEEGMEIEGTYNDETRAVEFKWNGQDAVLYVDDTCEIIGQVAIEYVVARENNVESAEESIDIFAELSEAKAHQKMFGGYIFYAAYWCDEHHMTIPCYGKTVLAAVSKCNKSLK